jgi:site-specific DNA recombinase
MRATNVACLSVLPAERRVALVVRVSTDHQASNPEGSLTTQLQRLRQHLQYKNGLGEVWDEVAVYELRAVSGKDSVRSDEFKLLYAEIESGRVNTVAFTALARLCRSVKDFLQFVAFLQEHGANFVSLKEDYDTTTAHGRLIMTIVMALAEFEREQTSERTRDAFKARSDRGLWNGGRLLGYDLPADRKGYLVPNQDEAAIVNFAFDAYLNSGSIAETAAAMNEHGYRTKSYSSRRGVEHVGHEFSFTTVQHVLKNPAYIGKKVVGDERHLIGAVWPGIVEQDKFDAVQALLAGNCRANRSEAKTVRHAHVLSRGLLFCGRCRSRMAGRSGTGRGATTYFYYACINKECGLRVVASEIEGAVLDRIAELAVSPEIVSMICADANRRRMSRLPALQKQLRASQRSLANIRAQAARLLGRDDPANAAATRSFVDEQLSELAQQRDDVERSIVATECSLHGLEGGGLEPDAARAGLANFQRVYEQLRPFEKQDLIRLVLHRAEVGDRQVVLELYEGACAKFAQAPKSASRFAPPIWLPGPVAQSVLRDTFEVSLPSLNAHRSRERRKRAKVGGVRVAAEWADLLAAGELASKAALAQRVGVSRARITQALGAAVSR